MLDLDDQFFHDMVAASKPLLCGPGEIGDRVRDLTIGLSERPVDKLIACIDAFGFKNPADYTAPQWACISVAYISERSDSLANQVLESLMNNNYPSALNLFRNWIRFNLLGTERVNVAARVHALLEALVRAQGKP